MQVHCMSIVHGLALITPIIPVLAMGELIPTLPDEWITETLVPFMLRAFFITEML